MSDGQHLAARLSVSELVPIFDQAQADILAAFQMIERATGSLDAAFTLDSSRGFALTSYRHRGIDFARPEHTLKELRRNVWKTLVERLELRRMMSIRAWTELEKQLDKGAEVPEVTEEAVSAMVAQFSGQLPEMLAEAVGEVFEWLRPHNSRHKTNTELEIGPKVVLTYIVECGFGGMQVTHYAHPRLTALENVFSALDGRGSVSKGHYSLLSEAIKVTGSHALGETEYFRFRCFRNGNLHIEFRRLDLLRRFNAIAGGRRLRPAS